MTLEIVNPERKISDNDFISQTHKALKLSFSQAMEIMFKLKNENEQTFNRLEIWSKFYKKYRKEIHSILGLDSTNFFKEYWEYRKECGELSMRAYANRKNELK